MDESPGNLLKIWTDLFCSHKLLKKYALRTIPTARGYEIRYTSKDHDPDRQWVSLAVEPGRRPRDSCSLANFRCHIGLVDLTVIPKVTPKNYLWLKSIAGVITRKEHIQLSGEVIHVGEYVFGFSSAIESFVAFIDGMRTHSPFYWQSLRLIRNRRYKRLEEIDCRTHELLLVPIADYFDNAAHLCLSENSSAIMKRGFVYAAEIARQRGFSDDVIRKNYGKILTAWRTLYAIV